MEFLENAALADWFADYGNLLWTYAVLPVLAIVGIYFTIRTKAVQFRMIPAMFRTLTDKALVDESGEKKSISSFQAFTISAASRVGTGNIAGVATAIAVGGPGAVFWMWAMAFIGGASSFVESTLGQLYKVKTKDGYRGGPAYYMQRGLKARWMGVAFAVILIVCFPFAFSSLQANTIAASAAGAFGNSDSSNGTLLIVVGVVLSVLTAAVVFGGVRRIAKVTEALVPSMAVLYLALGVAVMLMHLEQIPVVFAEIFSEAFNVQSAIGGGLGAVILQGIKRGMFSNEAGLGSAPNAGATASVTHPVKQGLVQTLGVYFDTFLICSITAFIILVSIQDPVGAGRGIELTLSALTTSLGAWAGSVLTLIIFLLGFSSVIGNYYYGESNIGFITKSTKVMFGYRLLATLAVLVGALSSADVIWNFADGVMGLMALINLVAIALLSGIVFKLLRNYTNQSKKGLDPVFTADQMPELDGLECWSAEDVRTHQIPSVKR
ncbi:alanine/glycine:cation symporter family protein [Paeniglutamicibacter cryotolerans]|uniref:AGCS family alanine or glycine:cation symporter n=1 Tax=Paeniglutamicibacter cryotolerans TaxID=670079 RepID=A0A839QH41_9MICC|nr:alanine/glycine:cation symporter family protein [Paeniglutamicibacter cryotolerans]MBB2994054.1 AGCS family alanine or glycine:cation symporter [Paeniglutamicibacter cryotolerans]